MTRILIFVIDLIGFNLRLITKYILYEIDLPQVSQTASLTSRPLTRVGISSSLIFLVSLGLWSVFRIDVLLTPASPVNTIFIRNNPFIFCYWYVNCMVAYRSILIFFYFSVIDAVVCLVFQCF